MPNDPTPWRHTPAQLIAGASWSVVFCVWLLCQHTAVWAGQQREVSGIYPHLAMLNDEGECGTGAVVPWADRLWVLTYAPHKPTGSSDKLYEITPELRQIIRPESIGGTPANRFIHRESQQLFIGPYAIAADGTVRTIPYSSMFGRPTGVARHLTDPADKVVYATMEEGFYEVDVRTLAVRELWADEQKSAGRHAHLPGYHGKGFYSAQGHYVYANNGEHGAAALTNPATPSGVLAEWDGNAPTWQVVRRSQFTDVTGPGGLYGNPSNDDRLWSIGWDHRSLILMLREAGQWHPYRLPKASHAYDGAHGWNTEWPRIREIGGPSWLMTMHGAFWKFPPTFSVAHSAGIAPRSTYLKVIGDFCRWGDRIVLGCDDTAQSEFLNKDPLKGNLAGPGRSQSNLWFVEPSQLDSLGPPLGRGAVWLDDDVQVGQPSEPFLFSGFSQRCLFLAQRGTTPLVVRLEVDQRGDGTWHALRELTVPSSGSSWTVFSRHEQGAWVRLVPARNSAGVTAFFHYRGDDARTSKAARKFAGWVDGKDRPATGGLLHARGAPSNTLRFLASRGTHELGCYELDAQLRLRKTDDAAGADWMRQHVAISAATGLDADAASVIYTDAQGRRWRLPKGPARFDRVGDLGPGRVCREVCTERNLLNAHGTFYELPAQNAGGFPKIRPIATHHRPIVDYASYRGLLVVSGVRDDAGGTHIIRSDDGACALWVGAVDDLWQLGKPRGTGGPWQDSVVRADVPSDPYLMTGFDHKHLTLSNDGRDTVRFTVQLDITGTGLWVDYHVFAVREHQVVRHEFPDALGAYWVRLIANRDTRATAQFRYE